MKLTTAQQTNPGSRALARFRNNPMLRYPELGLMCLGIFVMLVGIGAVVPIRAIYARDHGATMEELGLLGSSLLIGQFLFQLPGGWASDKFGRKPLMIAGMVVAGFMSFAFLLNDHPWYFITLRFIEGVAGAAIFPAANAYVMDAVPAKERGAAFGWLGSATSAGFMIGPAVGGPMVDAFGYASPFVFGGVAILVVAFVLAIKMQNIKPGERPPAPEVETNGVTDNRPKRQIPSRLFIPSLIGATVLTMAAGFGDGIFISLWTIWLDDLNASTSFIGLTFIIFSLPLMVLMPFTGKWADKYRLTPLLIVPGLLISTIYLSYGFTTDLLFIASVGLFEGILLAISIPALSAFVANFSPDHARGRVQGVITTARTLAGASSALLTAVLYKQGMAYPWLTLFAVQVVVTLIGGFLVWRVERQTYRAPATPGQALARETSAAPVLETAAK